MIKKEIVKLIERSVKSLEKEGFFTKLDLSKLIVEKPENELHGDYSANIALILAKIIKKNPMETANLVKEKILTTRSNLFERIDIVNGFINFFISKECLQDQVGTILKQKEKFGNLEIGKRKRVNIEFISANPTGPLTIGNSRGGPFGDVLGNIFEKAGFKTEKSYYVNNYGVQILALGHSVLKDSEAKYKGDYIDYLNKKIKEKDPFQVGQKAAELIVKEMIKKTTDNLGIKYDEWFFEKTLHEKGEVDKILEVLKKKELIYEKEGAKWFKSSKYGDERDRVLVKSDGKKTYLAGDIAYHKYKFEKKKFGKAINVWGADHYGDILGLLAGVEAIGHGGKLEIIIHQFITLYEKKEKIRMSKRKGIYVTMDELFKEVGRDVIRFFFLQKSINTHLDFDLSLAREQSKKNPVYYIQYAYTRICSILRKSKTSGGQNIQVSKLRFLNHQSELKLIKQLIRFPEIIEKTVNDYQIQRIPQYATDLATSFHQFYRDCRVISEDKKTTEVRLALILATKIVLKNTLDLMGISAPEKM